MSADASVKMVYRNGSLPFTLTTTSENLAKTTLAGAMHQRRGVLVLGKSELVFELGKFEVDDYPLSLHAYIDTLAVGHTGVWEEMFRTEIFQVTNETHVTYLRASKILNRSRVQNELPASGAVKFLVEVVDANTGAVLATPDVREVRRNEIPADSRERKTIVFTLAGSKELYVRVRLQVPPGLVSKQSMVEVFIRSEEEGLTKGLTGSVTPVELSPKEFELSQNYPNPFNPATVISYAIPKAGFVTLRIFNLQGQEVTILVEGDQPAGRYQVPWNGQDRHGQPVAAGLYFYTLEAGELREVKRMVLLK